MPFWSRLRKPNNNREYTFSIAFFFFFFFFMVFDFLPSFFIFSCKTRVLTFPLHIEAIKMSSSWTKIFCLAKVGFLLFAANSRPSRPLQR